MRVKGVDFAKILGLGIVMLFIFLWTILFLNNIFFAIAIALALTYWFIFIRNRVFGLILYACIVVYSKIAFEFSRQYIPVGYLILFIPFLIELVEIISQKRAGQVFFKDKIFVTSMVFMAALVCFFVLNIKNFGMAFKGLEDGYKFLFVFLLGYLAKLKRNDFELLFNVIVYIWLSVAVVGIVEYIFFKGTFYSFIRFASDIGLALREKGYGYQWVPFRNYSIVLSALATGFISMALALYFFKKVVNASRINELIISIFFLVVSSIALITSFARSAWLGTMVGCSVILVASRRLVAFKRTFVIIIFLLIISNVIPSFKAINSKACRYVMNTVTLRDSGAKNHLRFINEGISRVVTNPFGLGIGSSIDFTTSNKSSVWNESLYFFILSETGIVGLILYMIWIVMIIRRLLFLKRKDSNNSVFFIAMFVASHICAVFIPIWFEGSFANLFFLILGAYLYSYGNLNSN